MTQGEDLNNSERYYIEYSLDIRGNITIWGGMSFYQFEYMKGIDDPKLRVARDLRPLYEYHRLHPATSRIYQMEQEIDETISDDRLIEALTEFRKTHPEDGFSRRMDLLQIGLRWGEGPESERGEIKRLRSKRDDEQEVLDRLLKQERRDIRNLWGIDCPPDINDNDNYGRRLMAGQGQVSDWFRKEFERLGGDWDKLWVRR